MALQTTKYVYKGTEDHSKHKFCLLTSQWHGEIVENLYEGAVEVLKEQSVTLIERYNVPGSYELPFSARLALDTGRYDAIICLGVIIKGETNHDEIIANSIALQISNLSAVTKIPILFGVLTTLNEEQAIQRSNGTHGHKGKECAVAALELLDLKAQFKYGRTSSGFKFT